MMALATLRVVEVEASRRRHRTPPGGAEVRIRHLSIRSPSEASCNDDHNG